ncbi:MAG: asparagine synthase (glutamine-hydrolyzing) [Chloroflexi bacterium]|nr:asparagine synthase (glutamine-hydrolyzing) [Chloroflexota bacterium]
MCGIAGALVSTGEHAQLRSAIDCMVAHLDHRGPDACASSTVREHAPSVVLGHTRLAIIDLSPAGQQPMRLPDSPHVITYNGEIYNFRELASELGDGEWQSRSDTEVVLRAYARWGRASVHRLRGMFALGIWDAERQELFLARDRLGIKPLYYYTADGLFVFASELRALLASGLVPRRLDPLGLADYLTYQSLPAPRTMIQDVRALPPGAWLVVDRLGQVREHTYWDLLQHTSGEAAHATPEANQRRTGELLRESVAMHLVSDVPLGAFLSGGIDSSLVVGLMREAGPVPHTFSVAFAEREFDETRHARAVATRFDTHHTEILLGEEDLLDQLPHAFAAMDQPTGDGVNTYVISGAVRAAGITVALSGLGGDELFGGYPSFRRLANTAQLFRAWRYAPEKVRTLTAAAVERVAGSNRSRKTAAMLAGDGRLSSTYPITRQVLARNQLSQLLTPSWSELLTDHADPYVALLEEAYATHSAQGLHSSISYAEARTYMHDVLLRDTDQMSMAHALEVRVPLLDHVLVEYVMGVPDAQKRPNGTPKPLLVNSLPGLLPDDIVHRRKQGFTLPFNLWMRQELRSYCTIQLGENGLGGRGIFQPDQLRALWSDFLERPAETPWSHLWVLVVLEEWLDRNGF